MEGNESFLAENSLYNTEEKAHKELRLFYVNHKGTERIKLELLPLEKKKKPKTRIGFKERILQKVGQMLCSIVYPHPVPLVLIKLEVHLLKSLQLFCGIIFPIYFAV